VGGGGGRVGAREVGTAPRSWGVGGGGSGRSCIAPPTCASGAAPPGGRRRPSGMVARRGA
jgi:hypothetical protein